MMRVYRDGCWGDVVPVPGVTASWLLATTKPGEEEAGTTLLGLNGWVAYLPRYRRLLKGLKLVDGKYKRTRGPGAEVWRPLFPRYVFVRLEEDMQWSGIVSAGLRLVGYRGEKYWSPSISRSGLVEELMATEENGDFDDIPRPLEVGAEVKVIRGPFQDQVGRIAACSDDGRVAVLLDIFSRQVRVEARREDLVAGG